MDGSEGVARIRALAAADHGLAVVSTLRRDGSIASSVVNAGVMDHPVSGTPAVAFVARGTAHKLTHLRRDPRVTLVFRSGWQWIGVSGRATLIGPDDRHDSMPASRLPQLLRDIFTAAGGTHDDWATFDRVMAEEGRTAVVVDIERISSNAG